MAKKPHKHKDLNKQRDREYIKRYNCNGLITVSINMSTFLITIHLKHDILHKRPERHAVSDTIKEKIKQYINFTPKDIFRQLEQENPDLTQKQVHAWWSNIITANFIIPRPCDKIFSHIQSHLVAVAIQVTWHIMVVER